MKTVCYCFNYTDIDIIDDFVKHHGKSAIMDRIIKAKREGTCECDIKNPKKR